MKKNKIVLVLLTMFCTIQCLFCQTDKVRGTYLYSDEEYIHINMDSFEIIRTLACSPYVDLDKGDSIISFGSVKLINNDFIELKSYVDSNFYKKISILETCDKINHDSLTIFFKFPFVGKCKIIVNIPGYKSFATEKKQITVPKNKLYRISELTYEIYNLDLKYNGYDGEYLGRIVFSSPCPYRLISEKTDYVQIEIPNLTNSYYARSLVSR